MKKPSWRSPFEGIGTKNSDHVFSYLKNRLNSIYYKISTLFAYPNLEYEIFQADN